ncbi:hypothetical protein GOODEAATRI_027979 [Goodea atripinnis]|uniref:Uncharacterized protein n=1 Tax=Goodea atripinnis TaxID=208336 RepID=A0ABV0P8B8_9TELE
MSAHFSSSGLVKPPQMILIAPTNVYQLAPPMQWESQPYSPRGRARGGPFGKRAGRRGGQGGAGSSSYLVCGQTDHGARSHEHAQKELLHLCINLWHNKLPSPHNAALIPQ